MKFHAPLLAVVAGLLFSAAANAQLKAPRDAKAPGKPAAQAPAAQSAPAAPSPEKAQPNPNADKEAAATLAAAGWLSLLDRRDWGSAWETSSAMFRKSVPLATWMDGIPKVREAMGKLVERAPAESVYKTTLEGQPDGEYVSVVYVSKFDEKELLEVVTTVRETDGKWRVTGYSTR